MTRDRLDVDLNTPEIVRDPYPTYDLIREAGRVVWNGHLNAWMVPGFDDCMEILTDRGEHFAILYATDPAITFWFDAPNMITVDGDEHRRLRGALAPHFTKSAVARWESRTREVVDDLLAPLLSGSESVDLAEFTKIPTVIVAEMLGVPEQHHEDFRRWSHAITGNVGFGHENPGTKAHMMQAIDELYAYMTEELERHRVERPNDLLTVMLDIADWTAAEIRSTAVNLLLAGYDTTARLISMCLDVFERQPEQRQVVADDLSLMANSIEEVLRWCGTVSVSPRVAMHDMSFAGTDIAKGDRIYTFQAAANRDPSRWDDPNRFDVRRPPKAHLGFGFGPHLCIGAPLARLETRVALERLFELAPDYHLVDSQWGTSLFPPRGPQAGRIQMRTSVAV